jgi:hypothetical protein
VGQLYSCFKEKGYLTNDDLLAQSARYVSIWQDARLGEADPYRNHSLLAHHILDHPSNNPTKQCAYCQLQLPKTAYTTKGWKNQQCMVCRAINAKNGLPSVQPMKNQSSQKSRETKPKTANRASTGETNGWGSMFAYERFDGRPSSRPDLNWPDSIEINGRHMYAPKFRFGGWLKSVH